MKHPHQSAAVHWFRIGLSIALACAARELSAVAPASQDVQFFEAKVRPVLVQHCYKCHSAEAKELKGDLLLDTRAGIQRGGESGLVIKPGEPDASPLVKAIRYQDKDLKMPPEGRLSDEAIADLETWIRKGAPDPREGEAKRPIAGANIDLDAARQFWSFQPLHSTDSPKLKNSDWPRGDVDRYILAGLENKGLQPVADGVPEARLRRLYFDLIGLPPGPKDVHEYVRNASTESWEKIVDKLLASPQFGARWGRHWLDVARYGESNGNTENFLFPYAWRYRDYVIATYNADTPFDQFVQQQIAGDLLPAKNAQEHDRNLIATGFLALTSKPRPQGNPEYAMDLVADQIEVTTTAMMGLTVACARCHDHKLDPISTRDYYALAGIFTSSEMLFSIKGGEGKNSKKTGPPTGLHTLQGKEQDVVAATKLADIERKLSELRQQLKKATTSKAAQKKAAELEAQFAAAANMSLEQLNALGRTARKKLHEDLETAGKIAPESNAESPDPPEAAAVRKSIAELESQRDAIQGMLPEPAQYSMGVREAQPADCAVCVRGEVQKRGDVVPRGFISVVNYTPDIRVNAQQSGRLELARWLTSPQNPLTARVYANRVWLHLFGEGLVRTPDNFGALGESPSHPELLDYLARYLIDHGWSTKQLIRHLVLSRTYQLSGAFSTKGYEVDPENCLHWRQAPRRLDAEVIRDAVLAVSGQLELQPFSGTALESLGEREVRDELVDQVIQTDHHFRSVYLPVVRNAAPEALGLFDVADSSMIVGARSMTTVPTQALYMMNSKFIREQARQAARHLLEQSGDDEKLIEAAYLLAYSRRPTSAERERLLAFLNEAIGDAVGKPVAERRLAAWASVWQSMFSAAEFRYLK